MQFWAMSNKKMKIFLIVFASIVLTFVGKGAFAHANPNSIKSKFSQSLSGKVQYFNAIEEEEISEDLHEEQDKVSSHLAIRVISTSTYASEAASEIPHLDKFAIFKSRLLALFKQYSNYRI